jgi:hypothetical protein
MPRTPAPRSQETKSRPRTASATATTRPRHAHRQGDQRSAATTGLVLRRAREPRALLRLIANGKAWSQASAPPRSPERSPGSALPHHTHVTFNEIALSSGMYRPSRYYDRAARAHFARSFGSRASFTGQCG